MARIRTIKPQFWTDETVGKLSLGARLLFIGSWNLADDEGILLWNASYLRGQLFPYDNKISLCSVKKWMDQLSILNFICVFEDAQKNNYGFVRAWHKHQVINRPQSTQHQDILDMIKQDNSVNNHGTFTEDSVTEKEEEKEEEKEKEKEKEEVIGNREKEKERSKQQSFEEYTQELKSRFKDIDVDVELEGFWLYWDSHDKKHTPSNPKLCLLNWLKKAREFKSKGSPSGNISSSSVKGGRSVRTRCPERYPEPNEI